MSTVLVFKTSVIGEKEVTKLSPHLDRLINTHGKWNFDLEDCDNILRVESTKNFSRKISRLLSEKGFACEEL